MTSILKVDQLQDSGGNAIITSDGAGNVSLNTTIENFVSTGIDDNATSTAITIDSSDNVGIGTTSPTAPLDVAGSINCDEFKTAVGNTTINTFGAYSTLFKTNNTERMRITSAGNVAIGTTSTDAKLAVNDNKTGTEDGNNTNRKHRKHNSR
jgi:hypothetical protein